MDNTINQLDLTEIYRTLNPMIAEFSSARETSSGIDHMLGYKICLKM